MVTRNGTPVIGGLVLRVRYRVVGAHVHCRVFLAASPQHTFAKCGELTFRKQEWHDVLELLGPRIELLEEGATPA